MRQPAVRRLKALALALVGFSTLLTAASNGWLDNGCDHRRAAVRPSVSPSPPPPAPPPLQQPTTVPLSRIAIGVCSSAATLCSRAEMLREWWDPQLVGDVYVDELPEGRGNASCALPPGLRLRVSQPHPSWTDEKLMVTMLNKKVHVRASARCSRIAQELGAMHRPDADWYVLADDDAMFSPPNLARLLGRYPSSQPWYLGSWSESSVKVKYFGRMAFGGGGIVLSAALMHELRGGALDACLLQLRGKAKYWLDERMWHCVQPLGVPLTRAEGMHQLDVAGDVLGLLEAHPQSPFVSLHHLQQLAPLPLRRAVLFEAMRADPARFLQQSRCAVDRRGGRRGSGADKIVVAGGFSVRWWAAQHTGHAALSAVALGQVQQTFDVDMRIDSGSHANTATPFTLELAAAKAPPCRRFLFSRVEAGHTEGEVALIYTAGHTAAADGLPPTLRTVSIYQRPWPAGQARDESRSCCRALSVGADVATLEVVDTGERCFAKE